MTDIVERLRAYTSIADYPPLREEAANEIERLRAEVAALRRDAERYRWLRGEARQHSERWPRWNLQRWSGTCWHSLERTALDAAIDAALEKEGT